jgi:DNA polymerase-3 subunit epsilon
VTFTAIDFETANADRASVCAVGLAIAQNGRITELLRQLIRPDPLRFDPFNVSIHGITKDDVADAPTFAEYWPELRARIRGPLVAHNAAFDMSVLRLSLDRLGWVYPESEYYCTRVIAKLVWPGQPSYGLRPVADMLGVEFRHHDPTEDARACALVAIASCATHGVSTLCDLEGIVGLRRGQLFLGGYKPCGGPRRSGVRRTA